MREKNTMWLCMRYSGSCKLCPRNKKCDEEIEKERLGVKYESKNTRNGIRNSNGRRRKRLSKVKRT